MISKLFRCSARKSFRSHFPVPDVPLPKLYRPRRHYSLYEMGMWYTDAAQPEYVVSISESYLGSTSGALREVVKYFFVFSPLFIVIFVYYTMSISSNHVENTQVLGIRNPQDSVCRYERECAENASLTRDVTGYPLRSTAQISQDFKSLPLTKMTEKSVSKIRQVNMEMRKTLLQEKQRVMAAAAQQSESGTL